MPRAKEFDESEVLDQALEVFRVRGFKHTSFEDLTQGLGVSRQSIYDTYGDKNALFHAALRRYLERGLEFVGRKLDDRSPIREVLAGLFEGMNSNNCGKSSPGCLMVNSMVELAPHDAEVRALAQKHARGVEGVDRARIESLQIVGRARTGARARLRRRRARVRRGAARAHQRRRREECGHHRDRSAGHAGSSRVSVVLAGRDSTDRCPDMRSASSLAIARPSPEPWASSAV